jgi:hypothetical protein
MSQAQTVHQENEAKGTKKHVLLSQIIVVIIRNVCMYRLKEIITIIDVKKNSNVMHLTFVELCFISQSS